MNKEWSELNKEFQNNLNKESTFKQGIDNLLILRTLLIDEVLKLRESLSENEFSLAPLSKSNGYERKTITYSLYHIFRIEDIVCNILINNRTDILKSNDFANRINLTAITTGNELTPEEVLLFSTKMNIQQLYEYIEMVFNTTNSFIINLKYSDLKTSFSDIDIQRIIASRTVSTHPDANWLIDYWCSKNIKGLLRMPFSRHWIMHIEASLRILNAIKKNNGNN